MYDDPSYPSSQTSFQPNNHGSNRAYARDTQYTETGSILDFYRSDPDEAARPHHYAYGDAFAADDTRHYLNPNPNQNNLGGNVGPASSPQPAWAAGSRATTATAMGPSQEPLTAVPLSSANLRALDSPPAYKEGALPDYPAPVMKPRRSAFRRYCCCCFRNRRTTIVCLVITFILLAGLGVTLFFVWPRIPDVQVTGVSLTSTAQSGGNSSSGGILLRRQVYPIPQLSPNQALYQRQASGLAVSSTALPLYFQIQAYNPNYIPWTVGNITATGSIKVTTSAGKSIDFPLGEGSLTESVTFPKFANTTFELPFQLTLDPATEGFAEASSMFLTKCTTNSPINFQYKAKVSVNGISWLIKPTIEDSANFKCPADALAKLGLGLLG
ncbi:hypothetical protein BJ085DRAFT_29663 [Dimargaris cristalligena]|uniref:Late embryogenesis abundant protein LEA-2 subgroup domain-containing protein n=1 Tax=Dimargaris cristalligena TaxID=215637 RepID=A0A4P9ZM43_9FUNG|nr:hypothetical protein BJ085DRAFT_29663 [Dimargaris cristalligena]|eukprot:RKP34243.1 hypothetical protein BJ085DRAFT_29663 [Dimargaris cristalligena]